MSHYMAPNIIIDTLPNLPVFNRHHWLETSLTHTHTHTHTHIQLIDIPLNDCPAITHFVLLSTEIIRDCFSDC